MRKIQTNLGLIDENELERKIDGDTYKRYFEKKINGKYQADKDYEEQYTRLNEIELEIVECENYIRHALIIGNNAVLENLRAEYKEMIAEREKLNATSEPITVAPTDHL